MKIVKGFVTISDFINNVPGETAKLGELSTWSLTFTKERGEYTDNTVPGYKLVSFNSVDTDLDEKVIIIPDQVREILTVVREIVSYAGTHLRPYDPEDFHDTILATFLGQIENFRFGDWIDNGALALPEWISWDSITHAVTSVKIWLADESFAVQYDDYEVTVIPPLDPLDDFFNNYAAVVQRLDERDPIEIMELIQDAKELHPETYVRTYRFDFVNTVNPTIKHPTYWNVLIYGQAGDHIDAVKDAIIEYVLSNSSHNQSEWEQILPDLFKRTEFIMYPRYDLMAIPNLVEISGLYQSIIDPAECVQFAVDHTPFYDPLHVEASVKIFPSDWKCLTIVSVDGANNLAGKEKLDLIFPDYLPIPSTHPDFSRMEPYTRDWVLGITEAFNQAERATRYSTISSAYRKVYRSDQLYISFFYDGVNYLVAARSNDFYGY